MHIRTVVDCLCICLFCVAAGVNLYHLMLGDARKKWLILDAVIGLIVLLFWAGSEAHLLI